MLMKKKFATKKEAKGFLEILLHNDGHMYKGHRGYVVQYATPDTVSVPLNADGKPRMSKEELDKQIIKLHKDGLKIRAIKLARIELSCGLREGLDYCKKIWNE